jgi:hypothetical protein
MTATGRCTTSPGTLSVMTAPRSYVATIRHRPAIELADHGNEPDHEPPADGSDTFASRTFATPSTTPSATPRYQLARDAKRLGSPPRLIPAPALKLSHPQFAHARLVRDQAPSTFRACAPDDKGASRPNPGALLRVDTTIAVWAPFGNGVLAGDNDNAIARRHQFLQTRRARSQLLNRSRLATTARPRVRAGEACRVGRSMTPALATRGCSPRKVWGRAAGQAADRIVMNKKGQSC